MTKLNLVDKQHPNPNQGLSLKYVADGVASMAVAHGGGGQWARDDDARLSSVGDVDEAV